MRIGQVQILDETATTRSGAIAIVEKLHPGQIVDALHTTVDEDDEHQTNMDGPPTYREAFDVVVYDSERDADDDESGARAQARYFIFQPR